MNRIINNTNFVNYLKELSKSKQDRNEDIRLNGVDYLFREIFDEVKSVKGHGYIKFVINSLNVRRRIIDNWRFDISPIPITVLFDLLELWKNTCNKSQIDFDDKFDKFFYNTKSFSVRKGHNVKLPMVLTPKFAYILGYLLGDGCLKDYRKYIFKRGTPQYPIHFASDSYHFANKILCPYFSEVFGINPRIYKMSTEECFEILIGSKVIYYFLNKVCDMPLGKKKGKLVIPSIIKQAPKEIQVNFVAGFFDADGCIYVKRKEIGIAQADKRFLEELSKLIKSFGIETRKIYTQRKEWGTTYSLTISWNSTKKFLKDIPLLKENNVNKAKEVMNKLDNKP